MRVVPPQCTQLTASCEGLRLAVYDDVAGYPTIGYGHRLVHGEAFTAITEAQALDLLRQDQEVAARAVDAATSNLVPPLTDDQFSALVDFTFNVGVGAFQRSTLLALLKAGERGQAIGTQLLRYNKIRDPRTTELVESPGLTRRRQQEAALFSKG